MKIETLRFTVCRVNNQTHLSNLRKIDHQSAPTRSRESGHKLRSNGSHPASNAHWIMKYRSRLDKHFNAGAG